MVILLSSPTLPPAVSTIFASGEGTDDNDEEPSEIWLWRGRNILHLRVQHCQLVCLSNISLPGIERSDVGVVD